MALEPGLARGAALHKADGNNNAEAEEKAKLLEAKPAVAERERAVIPEASSRTTLQRFRRRLTWFSP